MLMMLMSFSLYGIPILPDDITGRGMKDLVDLINAVGFLNDYADDRHALFCCIFHSFILPI